MIYGQMLYYKNYISDQYNTFMCMNDDRLEVGKKYIYIIYSDTMLCSAIFDIISQTTKDVVCSS